MKNVILFFSYKGGVGRSLNILNTAFIMAGKYKKRIGLIDADLEAPSLHLLLNIIPDDEYNFLNILVSGKVFKSAIEAATISLRDVIPQEKREKIGEGEIFLIPSKEGEALEYLQLEDERIRSALADSLEELLNNFFKTKNLNYIFIDCKAGLSRLVDLILDFSDIITLNFRVDRQNLTGVKLFLQGIRKKIFKKPFILVANQLPLSSLGNQKLLEFQQKIGTTIDVVVPFNEKLIFGDFIPTLETDFSENTCLPYEEIAKNILKGGRL